MNIKILTLVHDLFPHSYGQEVFSHFEFILKFYPYLMNNLYIVRGCTIFQCGTNALKTARETMQLIFPTGHIIS